MRRHIVVLLVVTCCLAWGTWTGLGQCGSEVEPNDSASAADELGSLPGSGCRRGAVLPSGDVDVYWFVVVASTNLVIETRTSGDTLLSVYDESGDLLAEDDDGGEGSGSLIEGTLEPGRYFAVVSGYESDVVDSYELRVQGSPSSAISATSDVACPVEVESNDSASVADVLVERNGVACRSGSIFPAGDADVYTFELGTTSSVVVETATHGDSILRLYDAQGKFLGEDDDGGADAASRIVGTLAPGRYFVTVREYGDDAAIPSYRITLTVGGSAGATPITGTTSPPPGGVPAGAPPWGWSIWGGEVVLSAWGTIDRDCPSDYDFSMGLCDKKTYTFTLPSAGFIALALIDAPGQWITAYVYDAGGRRVAMKLGVSAPIYSGWFEVPAGTYRVEVVPGKRLDKSPYELHVLYRATQPAEGYLVRTYGPADRQIGG